MKNYDELNEVVVTSQEEMDEIPSDFRGEIYINADCHIHVKRRYYLPVVARGDSSVVAWGDSSVEAKDNSSVVARDNSSVVARDNSSVVAWGDSSVVAWDNSSVVAKDNSSVVAWGDSSVVAKDNSSVEAWDNSSVEAWDNSSVEAWDNSSVEAWGDSSVEAKDNSSVEAWDNSSVEAWDNSSVEARGNSSVEAWDNSSVEARGNSSVEARGNSQIVDKVDNGKIKISGNARIVYMPKTIHEFMDFYGIKHDKKKATFYKAVGKDESGYYSSYNNSFRYNIGEVIKERCDDDVTETCSFGIHIAHLNWALNFGSGFTNLAILEVETDIDKIVMPTDTGGKVRTSEIKVIREVPLEECGVYGKILAKRKQNN